MPSLLQRKGMMERGSGACLPTPDLATELLSNTHLPGPGLRLSWTRFDDANSRTPIQENNGIFVA